MNILETVKKKIRVKEDHNKIYDYRYRVIQVGNGRIQPVTPWYPKWDYADDYIAENTPEPNTHYEIITEYLMKRATMVWCYQKS